ncbi:MAG TPA: heat-inducible transcriptional repressor HrcA [Candidatus Hydrogenedentes bacterium]|nr:heat-inducible transcriptional repressor HrcA [Candidatus Hydrogenedentota bacterium]HOS02361.1 heat-inducible transcriptional repressor HrcA [Candidatus Hydrogenedentota bacterium]
MTPGRELNEREQLILHAVVHTYITTAEAVGSRTIVKRFDLDLSPATVRNAMADLEEAGYLEQLHTSSGRVPTDRGYRYYVDYLMRIQELTISERDRIERELSQRLHDSDDIMRQTSHLLALVSHQTGLVDSARDSQALVRRIEVVPIAATRFAVMVADNFGGVRTTLVNLERTVSGDDFAALNRFLNSQLSGEPADQLRAVLQRKLDAFAAEQRRLADVAVEMFSLLPSLRQGQLFLEGATQLFEQPEFHDVAKARSVFTLLEERERLAHILRGFVAQDGPPRATVVIGSETNELEFKDISVVASPYCVGNKTAGMVGVLGPRRMPYSRLTALVDYTAGALSRLLTRLAG